ncbi:MAG TPA: twin-arginine translocase TatA/TatE family subunit [Dongiaceae bacterium]|jgi:sec-independent protein translocase protein TatA|nr:twin-arginine translocase TatA/TatE family subunit [Dongiaceae bacterium]
MGSFSLFHWLILIAVLLVVFGTRGKIPTLMKDLGQGINAFKKGLKETSESKSEAETRPQPSVIDKQG